MQASRSQRASQPGQDREQHLTGERSGRSHLCCWAVRPQSWPGLSAIPSPQLQCRDKGPELEFGQQWQAARHTASGNSLGTVSAAVNSLSTLSLLRTSLQECTSSCSQPARHAVTFEFSPPRIRCPRGAQPQHSTYAPGKNEADLIQPPEKPPYLQRSVPAVLAAATEAVCAVMQKPCLAEREAVTWAN